MKTTKRSAFEVERAHLSGQRLLLGDGDGLYLRKQPSDRVGGPPKRRGPAVLPG